MAEIHPLDRPNDRAPHSAILTISGLIHQRLPDGSFHPTPRGQFRQRVEIRGETLELARESADRAVDLMIERMRASGIVCDRTEALGNPGGRPPGVPAPPPALFGMRGGPARRDGD